MQMTLIHRLAASAVLTATLLVSMNAHAEWQRQVRQLMGTEVSVELMTEDTGKAEQHIEAVFAEFQRLDQMMNPWNPASELSRINREAGAKPVTTTEEIVEVIGRALHYSALSNGAFDISFASVGQHYDYRKHQSPSSAQLSLNLPNIDYRAIKLQPDKLAVRFTKTGLQVDLGGIAKGYAVDRAIDLLASAGVTSAVVSAGGDSRILGDLGDRQRTFGIRHPRKEGEYAVLIPLADTALSTSGDYERYFIENGERFHHILNPRTGRSASEVQSVSVLAARAIDSDALSTATFVLGVEDGLSLINGLADIEAIIIDGAGKLHYSEGLLMQVNGNEQQ